MTTDSSRIQVNVHSRLTVVSNTPTEPIGQICSLTPIDHTMGSHTVHIIFYYRTSPFSKQGRYAMDLDNVRFTLSDLLSKYPKMTGRLVRDGDGNWEVKYNDAGVRMYKANVGTTIDEWLRLGDESDERNLTTWEEMPDGDPTSWSPFQIQVLLFMVLLSFGLFALYPSSCKSSQSSTFTSFCHFGYDSTWECYKASI